MNIKSSRKIVVQLLAIICFFSIILPAVGGGIDITHFDDEQQEIQYASLIKQLRCLVCQNQTLSESDAPLAKDMRLIIGDMVRANAGDKKIIDFMVARYGDFVLYQPPVKGSTAALWLAPFVLVVMALALLPTTLRRQRRAELSVAQRQDAARLLEKK
ncbi:cytochrome c-type biogenesis protein CcmH [Candidatus Persebacteraceae bacterium Df01]|jgi:cytochrome c-type biogenesis protein CcmH|uniref:Cytochrome c-type biogenesis protein n=1 Tax=Candidatus Doriopsillibacter californiensis TaxID=2970740 RepID=A0ABT7QL52_9GAMM|nr:cytochrome c-type biogenesis protein CcmH [Candidatus Persebacteraceae bacterium Df01]